MTDPVEPDLKPTILVVDDTPDNLMQVHRLLQDQYQVRLAINGEKALEAAAMQPLPELILLDVVMPRMDGYEVCRRLKANPATADVPVIFLTGQSDIDDEQKGLEAGAVDYIAKPISPPILAARVRSHVSLHQRTRKLNNLAGQLSRYLAPQIYRSIFEGSADASVGTRRKKLTVLSSGITDFAELTEDLEPEDLTWLLNNYLSEMSSIAMEYGGTVDNFIGDAMTIFFGDPQTLGNEQDAVQCVRMAIAMQRRMDELQIGWRSKGYEKPFRLRIGIHTGFCNVGNFGSDLRINYTAIGAAVNRASHLQPMADPGGILMSYETNALVQNVVPTEEGPPVQIRGVSRMIGTYTVAASARV